MADSIRHDADPSSQSAGGGLQSEAADDSTSTRRQRRRRRLDEATSDSATVTQTGTNESALDSRRERRQRRSQLASTVDVESSAVQPAHRTTSRPGSRRIAPLSKTNTEVTGSGGPAAWPELSLLQDEDLVRNEDAGPSNTATAAWNSSIKRPPIGRPQAFAGLREASTASTGLEASEVPLTQQQPALKQQQALLRFLFGIDEAFVLFPVGLAAGQLMLLSSSSDASVIVDQYSGVAGLFSGLNYVASAWLITSHSWRAFGSASVSNIALPVLAMLCYFLSIVLLLAQLIDEDFYIMFDSLDLQTRDHLTTIRQYSVARLVLAILGALLHLSDTRRFRTIQR